MDNIRTAEGDGDPEKNYDLIMQSIRDTAAEHLLTSPLYATDPQGARQEVGELLNQRKNTRMQMEDENDFDYHSISVRIRALSKMLKNHRRRYFKKLQEEWCTMLEEAFRTGNQYEAHKIANKIAG